MSIYTPEYFKGADGAASRQLIEQYPFATLITSRDGAEPQITYLPLLLEGDALVGHMARPNPHWQCFAQGRTLALFHGPHAFVSAGWYVNPADHVPTWNYAVVHVHGQPQLLDETGARGAISRLTERFEGGAVTADPAKVERLLKGIVAFRIPITRLEAKFKMSQNRNTADRAGVLSGLRATGRGNENSVADWMEAHE